MKSGKRIGALLFLWEALAFSAGVVRAEVRYDSVRSSRLLHRMEVGVRPAYVFPTNSFLKGRNEAENPIRNGFSAHLKYAFQFRPGSQTDRIFGGVYQGIGLAGYTFGNGREVGTPLAVYLLQGARIARIAPRVSFNYEWNFGLSWGWHPFDEEHNGYNVMIGSRMNAYINAGFYLDWILSRRCRLTSGVTLTHFSNGNTRFPNAGMNTMALNVGWVYYLREQEEYLLRRRDRTRVLPFPRHMSYDLTLFGSWRRKGYFSDEKFVPSPNAYKVLGINLAAMYNVSYKFRTGVSLDWVYDASANVFVLSDPSTPQGFVKPPFNAQIALGVSGRAEYVTPYFIVGVGMGVNVLDRGGDLRAFYQMLTLKISMTRRTYLHIGYNLKDFRDPNFLMLGVGYRFNNRYPRLY